MNARRRRVLAAALAALWSAAVGAHPPEGRRGRESENEERERIERYQAAHKALHDLIAEATQLQTAYLGSGDLATFEKAAAAWEERAARFLRRNMPPLYANEFARAKYRGPDVPAGRDAKGRAAYQRIEARKVALQGYLTELWKPD